ncbi:MAG: potassium transporter TrkG [Chloroflexota bacterium]|nr:potassium transporter TrkG [Chloroflexota bacterium]
MPFFLLLIMGFAVFILVGAVLLALPESSAAGDFTSPVDALFTATSAVTVTGLAVVTTGDYWSPFGQAVILVLIQLGGLGFMVMSSILLILAGQRVSWRDFRLRDALGTTGGKGFARLVLKTLAITVVFEGLGTFLLWTRFQGQMTPEEDWWQAAFHAISAFNNAGFDIIRGGQGMVAYRGDTFFLAVVMLLIFFGGLSAPVIVEMVTHRGWSRLSLDAKLALSATAGLLALGALGVFFLEYSGSLGDMPLPDKALNAFFTSVTARTAGFSTLDLGAFSQQALFLMAALMFVGGVSGSTAGGIKVNTFTALVVTAFSYVTGRRNVSAFGREIPEGQVHQAIAVALLSGLTVYVASMVLTFTESASFLSLSFESVSAFGTVGLTTGVTPTLSLPGRLIITVAMFVGRLGPLTIALALTERQKGEAARYPEEPIRVG